MIWAWAVVLLMLVPLQDSRPVSVEDEYNHARLLLLRGQLIPSQEEANLGYQRVMLSDPERASKFRLLVAEDLLLQGMYRDSLRLLVQMSELADQNDRIQKLTLETAALIRLRELSEAANKLTEAENLCKNPVFESCGSVLRAQGVLAIEREQLASARTSFVACFSFASAHHDPFLAASALLNLGVVALQNEHYDEAADWSKAAQRAAADLHAETMLLIATGNLGWAYFQLGDHERALDLFFDAEKSAGRLGSMQNEIRWLENIGYVYYSEGDLTHATSVYRQALELARRIDSKSDVVITLEDLAFSSIDAGRLDEASSYLDQAGPLVQASGRRGDEIWVELARGRLAALRREDRQAEISLRDVQQDHESQTSIKLEAGHQLARLEEAEGHPADADRSYRSTLVTFERARDQIKKEDSRLPFLANAAAIYDDYIHFLVQQGKPIKALDIADQSRARTLEQGLGIAAGTSSLRAAAFDPRSLAVKTQSTLLFYWLGEKDSYLWAITPAKIAFFSLPPRQQITAHVENYRKALLDLHDPLESENADGQALYQILVAPAAAMIHPNKPVIILDEGILSKLNFETLLAPAPISGSSAISKQTPSGTAQLHYLIDDLTLSSAPSLAMLAARKSAPDARTRMLLLGNPVSPNLEFPTLPLFSFEMSRIESHFASQQLSVFGGPQATPAAYAASQPERYSYIHFVSHAVANSTDPLDSAIILSNSAGQEDSYKLYAREIIQHPIDAKLVTISACYGSGTRAYAGEGLVGLSWAFLRAGAHRVIGALWEVSDDSTPRLMDSLYGELASGSSPELALHNAKLALLHSQTRFRIPFYWAPFQMYGRQ
jgi:CHAT domain-containing protein/Tfp pilus assembly protein PilF